MNVLRSIDVNTEGIPINLVYLHPTIGRLSRYICDVAQGHKSDSTQETIQRMNELVEKYSSGFPQHIPVPDIPSPTEIILLTGSTGGMGSYVLECLINDEKVSLIYCLNRRSIKGSIERQRTAFENRAIDLTLLGSRKLIFLEGDASEPYLGLSEERYAEVRKNITSVLHIGKEQSR
jgi:hypothetical protein